MQLINNTKIAQFYSCLYQPYAKFSHEKWKHSNIAYDYTLKTNVLNLYHDVEDVNSYAVLKIRFDLVSNKELLNTYSYDKKVKCETTNAYGFVMAINKALDEVSSDLLVKLSGK